MDVQASKDSAINTSKTLLGTDIQLTKEGALQNLPHPFSELERSPELTPAARQAGKCSPALPPRGSRNSFAQLKK